MDIADVDLHFIEGQGLAVLGGRVSGGLEIVDVDDATVMAPLLAEIEQQVNGLAGRLRRVQTPSGGLHLYYRCPSVTIPGSMKLAMSPDGKTVRIETRGEGGYAVTAPTPGYRLLGGLLDEIPSVIPSEREAIIKSCRSFDLRAPAGSKPVAAPVVKSTAAPSNMATPMDDFNHNGVDQFKQMLEEEGWTRTGSTGSFALAGVQVPAEHWTRPGKTEGVSASLYRNPENNKWYFHTFSSSIDLEPNQSHQIGHAWAVFKHGGDYKAALADFRRMGFKGDEQTAEEDFADGVQAVLLSLAGMGSLEYERARKKEADKLGIRVSTLDGLVDQLRTPERVDESGPQLFHEINPWPSSVAGDDLLDEVKQIIESHVVMQPGASAAMALWVVFTYVHDSFTISPLLAVISPAKRCGKTTSLDVVGGLAYRALSASNTTAAAIFRCIEVYTPTLLLDEMDTYLPENQELRGVINGGHRRSSAFVLRCIGDDHDVKPFPVWCPKMVAMIGEPPDTIKDRAVVVRLHRKLETETVERIPLDFVERKLSTRRQCLRWANDHAVALKTATPEVPTGVGSDRSRDNWLPLLAIAEAAGGDWPQRARTAMVILETPDAAADETLDEMLLRDTLLILGRHEDRNILSRDLVCKLNDLDGRPWSDLRGGKQLTTNSLARMLRKFGLRARTVRVTPQAQSVKGAMIPTTPDRGIGYVVADFQPVFGRYIPLSPPHPEANP